jgi:MoaA/NifB/PqqE/SkfB family radical SAM enzyme
MKVTSKMLENGFTGMGEADACVGDYVDGKLNGIAANKMFVGEYKDNKLNGYAIAKSGSINIYEDNNVVETVVDKMNTGNTWIAIGDDVGLLIRPDGTAEIRSKIIPVPNALLVLTKDKVFKRIGMFELKMRKINFKGWHCPISNGIFNINPDGAVFSGVCSNVQHTSHLSPWWKLEQLEVKREETCNLVTGHCFCDADIQQPKAIDKETYDWFVENKAFEPREFDELPIIADEEEIIAVGARGKKPFAEVHFHIGRRCNFDCTYCPGPQFDENGEKIEGGIHDNFSPHMTLESFQHCLNLLKPHLPEDKRIFITGGEPTINPDLTKLVDHAINEQYEVHISTNGTATPSKLKELLAKGCKLEVSFHIEFTTMKVVKRIADLIPEYKDSLIIKVMAFEDAEFASKVREVMPKDLEIFYYPIYGRDLEHTYYKDDAEKEELILND